MKEQKGYEKLDGKEECEEAYREKMDRNRRIQGYDENYQENYLGGFIPRNNVKDRL